VSHLEVLCGQFEASLSHTPPSTHCPQSKSTMHHNNLSVLLSFIVLSYCLIV
jgi:hypothetical protein